MQQKEFKVLLTKSFPLEFLSHYTPHSPSYRIHFVQHPLIEISMREIPWMQLNLDKFNTPYVFSSQNAVRSFMLNNFRPKLRSAFAISGATAELLSNNAWNILGKADDASELAEIILSSGYRELVFCCGSRRLDTLPSKLQDCGIKLHEFVLYDTHLKSEKLNDTYDAVAFFSPSAVESFFLQNHLAENKIAYCLGNSTASELKKHWKGRILMGKTAKPDSLFKTILNSIHEHTQ